MISMGQGEYSSSRPSPSWLHSMPTMIISLPQESRKAFMAQLVPYVASKSE